MSLWSEYKGNVGLPIGKWEHFFEIYDKHFGGLRNKKVCVWEIGVAGGGSSHLWRRYFGPRATVVGIDIDKDCLAIADDSVVVRIGHQADHHFLQSLTDEFGLPDIVIDDGSHIMQDVITTFSYLYPQLNSNSFYAIEDMHTALLPHYGGGDLMSNDNVIGFSKGAIDSLYKNWFGRTSQNKVFDDTYGIYYYDSLIIFEKGAPTILKAPVIGAGYESPK